MMPSPVVCVDTGQLQSYSSSKVCYHTGGNVLGYDCVFHLSELEPSNVG